MSRELRALGPIEVIDRGLLLVRRGGLSLAARPLLGGCAMAFAVMGAYYLERVEGVRSLRVLIAFALVLAWWGRALLCASAARDTARRLSDVVQTAQEAGRPVDVFRTASIVGLGLWAWLWLLVAASLLGAWAVPVVLPMLALRGAVAPSWLARAGCTTEGGWRCVYGAAGDQAGRRALGVTVELLVLFGAIGLAINLFFSIAVFLLLGRSMLGLDVAFVDSFLSVQNVFVLLGVGAAALVLLEPLRVALSALAYVDARVRQEGLDLRAAVDEAIDAAGRRGGGSSRTDVGAAGRSAAMIVCVVLSSAALSGWLPSPVARAQPLSPEGPVQMEPLPPGTGPQGVAPTRDPAVWDPTGTGMPPKQPGDFESISGLDLRGGASAAGRTLAGRTDPVPDVDDDAVRQDVTRILEQKEFEEFADARGKGIRELIERFFEWLLADREQPEMQLGEGDRPSLPMPSPTVFLVLGALLLIGVLFYVALSHRQRRSPVAGRTGETDEVEDPRERAPEAHLDDAAQLAGQGRFREALRSLYVATLVALDRRRMISFDPALTNWQYIRPMPRGAVRTDFSSFTRLFDYKWYGDEATTEKDYQACRELARRIVADAGGGGGT